MKIFKKSKKNQKKLMKFKMKTLTNNIFNLEIKNHNYLKDKIYSIENKYHKIEAIDHKIEAILFHHLDLNY